MKKIIILFLGVLLFSCSSDNADNSIVTPQRLLGKWNVLGTSIDGAAVQNHVHNCGVIKDFREFFSTGKTVLNSFNTACLITSTLTSDWVLSGNVLKISSEQFDPLVYEELYVVESLTKNQLILRRNIVATTGTTIVRTTFTRD